MPNGSPLQTEIEIDAPPEVVFDILRDVARYPEWNPFTPHVDSTLELDAPVRMRVRLFGERWLLRQVEYVTANERPERLCWGVNMPLSVVLRAERCQRLEALPGNRTRYVCREELSGWLTPVVVRYFGPAMQRGFDDCALALKKRAEA